MVFFPKHLGFHSLGILLSICTQNWGGKFSCGQTTAIAFDTAVPHYWPLLILWAAHEGYFHKSCCWIRVLLCLCVMNLLIPSKPCLSMVNRKWGGGSFPLFTFAVLSPAVPECPEVRALRFPQAAFQQSVPIWGPLSQATLKTFSSTESTESHWGVELYM